MGGDVNTFWMSEPMGYDPYDHMPGVSTFHGAQLSAADIYTMFPFVPSDGLDRVWLDERLYIIGPMSVEVWDAR